MLVYDEFGLINCEEKHSETP